VYVDCSKRGMLVVTKQGQVYGCGDNRHNQIGKQDSQYIYELSALPDFNHVATKVAAGLRHSLI